MIKILLIEDNPGDARLVKELLNDIPEEHYQISHFDKLCDGIEYLNKNEVDIVLLDLSLPDSIGFNTFSQIRSRAAFLPIIILTGSSLKRSVLRSCLEAVDNYLVKGYIDSNSLNETIHSSITKRKAKERLEEIIAR